MRACTLTAAVVAGAVVVGVTACGGGYSSPPAGSTVTVTISANGASPKTIEISAGTRVRFVNTDAATHEILSTPHLAHTDCPSINTVGTLGPGAERTTDPLNNVRRCGYHDHLNPDEDKFRGQINVGTSSGPAPGYVMPSR